MFLHYFSVMIVTMTVFCVYAIVHLLYIIYLSLYNFFCVFKVDVKKIIHIQKYIFIYFLNVAAAFFYGKVLATTAAVFT